MFNRQRRVLVTLSFALGFLTFCRTIATQEPPTSGKPSNAGSPEGTAGLVEITGEISKPQTISTVEFRKLPRQSLRAQAHDGLERLYEGVPLVDVLAMTGVPTDKNLRGQALAIYVAVEASDGYRAVFSLAELDRSMTDRVVLLADRRDGQPLTANDGPLSVVVPGEKKHARWVKQVIRLKVGRG
jgi:DMSO/TMAO reductase YedYZ molybdopterin-dependent catalytic subunit